MDWLCHETLSAPGRRKTHQMVSRQQLRRAWLKQRHELLGQAWEELNECVQKERKGFPQPNPNYMEVVQCSGMKESCRNTVCKWVLKVSKEFHFTLTTASHSIHYMDRYLSTSSISRKELRLLPLVAILVASKTNETNPLQMHEAVHIAQSAFTAKQIQEMELRLLVTLNWRLHVPCAIHMGHLMQRYVELATSIQVNDSTGDVPSDALLSTELNPPIPEFQDIMSDVLCEYKFLVYHPSVVCYVASQLAYERSGCEFPGSIFYKLHTIWFEQYEDAVKDCRASILKLLGWEQSPSKVILSSPSDRAFSPTSVDAAVSSSSDRKRPSPDFPVLSPKRVKLQQV